jgi:hypothetical protein
MLFQTGEGCSGNLLQLTCLNQPFAPEVANSEACIRGLRNSLYALLHPSIYHKEVDNGAWLIGIGVFAIHSTWERDYARVKAGVFSYLAFGLLELVALARFTSDFNWAELNAWMYVGFVFSIVLVGLYSAVRLWAGLETQGRI